MPSPPEIRDRNGAQRIVEILKEMEAQHSSHADRHVAVCAEIKIKLEGEKDRAKPRGQCSGGCGARGARQLVGPDRLPERAHIVRDQDLLEQALQEPQHAEGEPVQVNGPLMQLLLYGPEADNRPCDELREHGNIGEIGEIVPLHRDIPPVQINGIAHGLECKKADADGKPDPRRLKVRVRQRVDGLNGKIRILKKAQHAQVDRRGNGETEPADPGTVVEFRHQTTVQIIHKGCKKHQKNTDRLTPGIKCQAEDQQYVIFHSERHRIIQDQACRQKEKQKRNAAEDHRYPPSDY